MLFLAVQACSEAIKVIHCLCLPQILPQYLVCSLTFATLPAAPRVWPCVQGLSWCCIVLSVNHLTPSYVCTPVITRFCTFVCLVLRFNISSTMTLANGVIPLNDNAAE